ncbi:MAG: dTDP-4-dehydrorhamnose reductase [Planctomycetes bacterium]|nr:dTDP-4-dehydrorhamnose reductase [Planctomycetota bacterium]
MKILVIGASGQLGSEFCKLASERRAEVIPLSHADIEVCDGGSIDAALEKYRPEVVLNTSAYHNVEKAEDEVARAFEVNAVAVKLLAVACEKRGMKLVHCSTDYVFDGAQQVEPFTEDDKVCPPNIYGLSKFAGEEIVREYHPRGMTVRLCGLYAVCGASGKGGNFVKTMLRLARSQGPNPEKPIKVVSDQRLAPTFTRHVSKGILDLLEKDACGLFHLQASGDCTWFEFSKAIFELAGLKPWHEPCTTAEFPTKARRPVYSVLDNARLRDAGCDDIPHWREGLAEYMKEELAL